MKDQWPNIVKHVIAVFFVAPFAIIYNGIEQDKFGTNSQRFFLEIRVAYILYFVYKVMHTAVTSKMSSAVLWELNTATVTFRMNRI